MRKNSSEKELKNVLSAINNSLRTISDIQGPNKVGEREENSKTLQNVGRSTPVEKRSPKQKNFYEEDDYIKNLDEKPKVDELGGEVDPYYAKKSKRTISLENEPEKPQLKLILPIKERKYLEDDINLSSKDLPESDRIVKEPSNNLGKKDQTSAHLKKDPKSFEDLNLEEF